ncbi:MAG: class I mannose-6-phosphate isomerase [Eubacteriales bacterium]|jgi:mannose-6-phosphate isomerase|nr:class I mannose-6-phosphate isomerase [Eubacteriales bacterium]MDD4106064.1 class I mannose-6-phosphate isomerase [Eubacteriales bacterium]NLO14791.1 mannose-6-phosphate isomerase [Clostridiales bacterium]
MPLAPIRMHPAYRFGDATPWGGETLRALFGRDIPDERTGESLEVSVIENLNSRDDRGTALSDIIDRYGARLTGEGFSHPFPLLLKLISARQQLSVQVHPGDDYARSHENKLGKSEAWVILAAEENARLVNGIKQNVTKEQLLIASQKGGEVEKLLSSVPVKPGDVFYIPAGTVHAIGGGITLYEIQQSSDVTYRFYDWERVDDKGQKRELHLEKALDVTNVVARMDTITPCPLKLSGKGKRELLLSCPYFGIEQYGACVGAELSPMQSFAIATAIKPATLSWETGELKLNAGDTALLPADGYSLTLTGDHLLLSYPRA